MKKFIIFIIVLVLTLTGCDRLISNSDEELLEMINGIFLEYDIVFEKDNFKSTESVILAIYGKNIPYTEAQIDDFYKLYKGVKFIKVFTSIDNKYSIIVHKSGFNNDNTIFYNYDASNKTIYIKQFDKTVEFGNTVEINNAFEPIRYVIFTPTSHTFDEEKLDILYEKTAENFAFIMEGISKHIEF